MAFDPHGNHQDDDEYESPEVMDMSGEEDEDGGSTHSSMADLIDDEENANWINC